MNFFLSWIKSKKTELLLFAAFTAVFTVTGVLYGFPITAALYPAVLCLVIGLLCLALCYRKDRKRHRLLSQLRELSNIEAELLPPPEDPLEADYQQLVRLLCDARKRLETVTTDRFNDMVDYYTVWAHQIKTPIAAMRLKLKNEDSAFARSLLAELHRVDQYVEMVMTFLRLDSDFTDYVVKNCALDDVLRASIKEFAGEFIDRRLHLDFVPTEITVLSDEKWLSFVVSQILSNALKYTETGTISVSLSGENVLCIRDTGIGISPEDLPRIFEKGFTGYNGRSNRKASGIGLYLCRRICDNLGHRIWAESEPDRGTSVYIDFSRENYRLE